MGHSWSTLVSMDVRGIAAANAQWIEIDQVKARKAELLEDRATLKNSITLEIRLLNKRHTSLYDNQVLV